MWQVQMTVEDHGMGDPSISDTVSLVEDGISVEREVNCHEEGIACTIEIRNERQSPVMVHVVDEAPSNVPIEDCGFKSGCEPDIGDISPERVDIRQYVDEEPVRIRYGLFPSTPVSDVQWDSLDIHSVMETSESGVANVIEDDVELEDFSTSLAEIFDEAAIETAREPQDETDGDHGGNSAGVAFKNPESATSQPERAGGDTPEPSRTDVRDDHVQTFGSDRSDEDRGGATVPRSLEIRLDHLTARVEEFAAYADAIEGIIDQYGTGTELVDGIERDLESLNQRLTALDDRVTTVRETHQEDVETVREHHQEDAEAIRCRIERVETAVDDTDARVGSLESETERLDDGLASVRDDTDGLRARLDEFGEELQALRETISTVRDDVDTLSGDVETIHEEVAALDEEIESLRSFRKSLAEISHVPDS